MQCRYVLAKEVADAIGGVVWGDEAARIYGIALPKDSDDRLLTYFEQNTSKQKVKCTDFSVCIIPMKQKIYDNRTYILLTRNVYEVIHLILNFLVEKGLYEKDYSQNDIAENVYIGKGSFIGKGVLVGENTKIANNVTLGNGVKIGRECNIQSNVAIYDDVCIGNNVVIKSGAVLGGDSFEFAWNNGYKRIQNIGTVVIGDNVTIGSNTTIDRGTIGNTFIGDGTIIDNLVQIGHEVQIGNNCRICAQCGLAGWSSLEDNVVLYGKVGVNNRVNIEQGAVVLGMSGVTKRVGKYEVVAGNPAQDNRMYLKEKLLLRRLLKRRV